MAIFLRPLTPTEFDTLMDDKSITVSYSPQREFWISEHDYTSNHARTTRNKIFLFKDSQPFLANKGATGYYFENSSESDRKSFYLQLVSNEQPFQAKYHSSLLWSTIIEDSNGDEITTVTFDTLRMQTSEQDTGTIDLLNRAPGVPGNIKRLHETWSFNKVRHKLEDNLVSWRDKQRLLAKWAIIDLYFVNYQGNTLYLHSIDAINRIAI